MLQRQSGTHPNAYIKSLALWRVMCPAEAIRFILRFEAGVSAFMGPLHIGHVDRKFFVYCWKFEYSA